MGDELGSATDIDRLLVLSGLSTPNFTFMGNDEFWTCYSDFMLKCPQKNGTLEFSWISRRDRVGFSKCLALHVHYCARVSASNFQVLSCSGSQNSTFKTNYISFRGGLAQLVRYDNSIVLILTSYLPHIRRVITGHLLLVVTLTAYPPDTRSTRSTINSHDRVRLNPGQETFSLSKKTTIYGGR